MSKYKCQIKSKAQMAKQNRNLDFDIELNFEL